MKKASNLNMEEVFDQLAKIKTVAPSNDLHLKTIKKLQKQNIIPLFWVKVAACFLLAIFATEYYLVSIKKDTFNKEISIVFAKTNNILYHE